ncbi:MAG: stage II sporulation protein E [Desulfitobacteriaceae bacterium]|nr:stage II sporulation protein E [Desulfitobacteriaceae bacterium]MDD4752064.1 stage II sporulation protein E [Desulfitobacteriaceae bacterium]
MSGNPQDYVFQRRGTDNKAEPQKRKKKIKLPCISLAGIPILSRETLFFAMIGFLLSRAEVLGSLLPFGPAYFAALVCLNRKQVVVQAFPVIAGLLTIVSGQQFLCNAGVIAILMIVFFFYSIDPDRQWVVVPALVLTATVVAKGITLIFGHASDYLIMVTIFESLFAAGLSLVFLVALGVIKNSSDSFKLDRLTPDETVCVFVGLLGVIMGLGLCGIGNVEFRSIISRFLIMGAAFLGGGGAGAGVGALVGIVPSLSEMVSPSIIGMYAFSGLLAGAFNGFGRMGVVMGFFLGNLLLALYLLNTPLIIASLTASAGAAVLLFVVPERWLVKAGKIFSFNLEKPSRSKRDDFVGRVATQRLDHMGKVFDELACTLDQISGEVQAAEEQNIHSILNHISGRICLDCTLQKMCWEKDFYQTYRSIMSLFAIIETNGTASLKDMPQSLRKRCSHSKEMLATVNCLYELYKKNTYWQRQMVSTRSLVANQLNGSAQIMNKLADEIKNYSRSRELLEFDLVKQLSKRGFPVNRANITGMTEKCIDLTLELQSCPGVDDCQRILAPVVSRLTGMPFRVYQSNCSVETGFKTCWFRMLAYGAKKLTIGRAQIAKEEGNICGDCSETILLQDGKQILMLSDGMGTGSKAAMESSTTLALLEQLLETGFNQQVAINTINSVLMLRSQEESFATLDLCIIDLYNGQVDFVKIGASPSYIKKADGVSVVRASCLPMGILHNVEVETIPEQVDAGDIIVMATDGLLEYGCGQEGNEDWVVVALKESTENNPQKLAEYLLRSAVHLSGGQPRDDITVMVALVEDQKVYKN